MVNVFLLSDYFWLILKFILSGGCVAALGERILRIEAMVGAIARGSTGEVIT